MPLARERNLRFTGVRLENWRNFTHVEVELQQRVFMVGPNASGKSNFLDAFRFLRDIASVGGGLADAVARRGGVSKIRSLAARRDPAITLAATLGDDEQPDLWSYELALSQSERRAPTVVEREKVTRQGAKVLDRPDEEDKADPQRLTQTHLEQVLANQQFREIADFLGSIRYLHVVPQLVREPTRWSGRRPDPYGSDLIERVADTHASTRKARLKRIGEALKVVVPQLNDLEFLAHDKDGRPHLRAKYVHWRAPGAWHTEEQFSDGTLRLIGLFWALSEKDGPLLLEEPELSLHPEIIRYIPQMLARVQSKACASQVLISTHSLDLLQDEGIGLDEVLLLSPGQEGTEVAPVGSFEQVRALLEGGLSLGDAIMPLTQPQNASQLMLFPM